MQNNLHRFQFQVCLVTHALGLQTGLYYSIANWLMTSIPHKVHHPKYLHILTFYSEDLAGEVMPCINNLLKDTALLPLYNTFQRRNNLSCMLLIFRDFLRYK